MALLYFSAALRGWCHYCIDEGMSSEQLTDSPKVTQLEGGKFWDLLNHTLCHLGWLFGQFS